MFGAVIDPNINTNELQITVIATGFDLKPNLSLKEKEKATLTPLDVSKIFAGQSGQNAGGVQPVQKTLNQQPQQQVLPQQSSGNVPPVKHQNANIDIPTFLQNPTK